MSDKNMEKVNAAFNEVNFTVFENGANLINKLLGIQNSIPEIEHKIEEDIEQEIQDMTILYNLLEKNSYKDIDKAKKIIRGLVKQINSNQGIKNHIDGDILKDFESLGN